MGRKEQKEEGSWQWTRKGEEWKEGREGGRKDGFKYLINIVSDNIPSVLGDAVGYQGVSSWRCEN